MGASYRYFAVLLIGFAFPPLVVAQPTFSGGPTFPPGYFKYGPSWLGSRGSPESFGNIFGPKRPDKLEKAVTTMAISRVGNGLAIAITVWGDVPEPAVKQTYELRYQLRLHTKKGEEGPFLGSTAFPKGVGPILASFPVGDGWNGMETNVDITRKELSGMTNLPEVKEGKKSVFVRFEPQIFDVANKKFLTPSKTDALILEVVVGPNRTVSEVWPLMSWVGEKARSEPDAIKPLLDDLDCYRIKESGAGMTLGRFIAAKETSNETKAKLIAAVPLEAMYDFIDRDRMVVNVISDLEEKAEDAGVKAAAKAKFEALREFNLKKPK